MNSLLWLSALLIHFLRIAGIQAYRSKTLKHPSNNKTRSRNASMAFVEFSEVEDFDVGHTHVLPASEPDRAAEKAPFLPLFSFLVGLLLGSVMGAVAMKNHMTSQLPPLEAPKKRGTTVRKAPQKRTLAKRKTTATFMTRKQTCGTEAFTTRKKSVAAKAEDKDLLQFDEAFESNDMEKFVELLASNEGIEPLDEKMHPWVENPKTVGTLAGTQLAILASTCGKDDPSVKLKIQEAGAIPMLVNFMRLNESDDRVQTAVVALSFLTLDCPENTAEAYDEGALELLLQHLESPTPGMRAAAATTLRNICMDGAVRCKQFVDMGGLKGLVNQLFTSPDAAQNNTDVQLESILNLQDILEGTNLSIDAAFAAQAVNLGVIPRLQILQMTTGDTEVREAAGELVASIQAVTTPYLG